MMFYIIGRVVFDLTLCVGRKKTRTRRAFDNDNNVALFIDHDV